MEIPYAASVRHDTGVTNQKLGVWLFLAWEVMLFGSLFSSYALPRSGAMSWPDQSSIVNVRLTSINTLVIIVSSSMILRGVCGAVSVLIGIWDVGFGVRPSLNLGISVLMGVTTCVLAGFLRFIVSIARRSRADLKVGLYDHRGQPTDDDRGQFMDNDHGQFMDDDRGQFMDNDYGQFMDDDCGQFTGVEAGLQAGLRI